MKKLFQLAAILSMMATSALTLADGGTGGDSTELPTIVCVYDAQGNLKYCYVK